MPGGMHYQAQSDYNTAIGFRNGLPGYASLSEVTQSLLEPHGPDDADFATLSLRSAIHEAVDAISQFAGWEPIQTLQTSRNMVSGKIARVGDDVELVCNVLLEALARQSRQARVCLATVTPLEPQLLWTANYIWMTTQKFLELETWPLQTIDGLPHETDGQTDREWWNTVLPAQSTATSLGEARGVRIEVVR